MQVVPELHDVVKLLDRLEINRELDVQGYGTVSSQSFEGVKFGVTLPEPATETWRAIVRHEGDRAWETFVGVPPDASPDEIESRRLRFITTLADRLASSVTRPAPGQTQAHCVRRLWGTEAHDLTLKTVDSFRDLLYFLNSNPTWEQFEACYHAELHSIPEDRRAPITSLYNHLRLTGKIAHVLEPEVRVTHRYGRWVVSFQGSEVDSLSEAHGTKADNKVGQWKFSLVKLWATIPHHMVRLQDLTVLRERREALKALARSYPDNFLYTTEDFALMFWPDFDPKILEGRGDFRWRFRLIESDATTMSSALDEPERFSDAGARRHGVRVYEGRWPESVPDAIREPLCPVCQLGPAQREWRKGDLVELLCEGCFNRRQGAPQAEQYARWDDLGVDVAWVKLAVRPDAVRKTVQQLDGNFAALKDFRSIPLEMDFLDDYDKVLEEWQKDIACCIPPGQILTPVSDYPELAILRLDQPDLWVVAVESFCRALKKYMPKLVDGGGAGCGPVQLFVDLSSPKYPFHEHWRYFQRSMSKAVNIRDARRSVDISLSPGRFEQLSNVVRSFEYRRSLHELAQLFEITHSPAAVLLSAWERRLALEKQLRATEFNVLDLVQLARLLG
jgi:hypothetical protein